jgi:carbon monoxide dehydrogenase subunit G
MLNDPAFLKACLPGCESLEASGPDQYQAVLSVGIAAVKGRYTGTVTLSEKEAPERFKMEVEGKGTGGFMRGTGGLALTEDPQGTKITYEGDIQVGGPIASVGQRLLEGATKMMVGQFFAAVNAQLAAMPAGPPPPPSNTGRGASSAVPPNIAPSFTGAPGQSSPWHTVLQYLVTQGQAKLRQWFSRSS